MFLVYFKGRGEWFIRKEDSFRLAIKRTTKKPYRKPSMFWLENHYETYHQWLNQSDHTPEKYSEWKAIYKDAINETQKEQYQSENHEYNYDLRGIFVRDPLVDEDIYDTDNLLGFGANSIECEEISGIFALTEKDEEACRLTSFETIKDTIKTLIPCIHNNSVFSSLVNEGKLSSHDLEQYFFNIQDKEYFDFFGKGSEIDRTYVLNEIKTKESSNDNCGQENKLSKNTTFLKKKNLERIKDLKDFCQPILVKIKRKEESQTAYLAPKEILYIPCTKDIILEELKKWSKEKGRSRRDCIWQSLNKMDQKLWESDERKAILIALTQGDKDIDVNFFKKNRL